MKGVRAKDRRVRMVFQGPNYALYLHISVFDDPKSGNSNLGLPLKVKGTVGENIKQTVDGVAHRIGISERLYDRKPHQLSEGQKQSVAVGHSIPVELLCWTALMDLDAISNCG